MPQMAPIWWTTMFMLFILSYMMIYMLMYFQSNLMPETTSKTLTKKTMNWKW